MKFSILILFVLAFILPPDNFAQTVPIERDINIWSEASVTFPLIKSKYKDGKEFDRLTFSINGTLRFGRNVSRPTDERIGFGFTYRLNKNISFTPDYFYRGYQPFRGRNDFESRVRFAVTLENKWKNFSISDRNLIEYRIRNSRPNSFRYTNRLRFNYPILKNNKEVITPFVSTEPFYDFQINKWTRNQFFAGFSKKFNKNFAADFFYLLVNDRNNPKIINGFGVNLKFRIE